MLTLFRDCYRVEKERGRVIGMWGRVLLDLVQSAPKEHFEKLEKGKFLMKNLRRDLIALIGCLAIIIVAAALLTYGRKNEVSSIMFFGYALDALVVTGILGNLLVFILVKTTRFNPLRIALWTFVTIHAVLGAISVILDSSLSSRSAPAAILIGYAVSLLFWLAIHWSWAHWRNNQQLAT